ncbi:MAG TPA: hypothetical protein VF588_19935 [Pyrinomonadaceae bacterium]|jgi:hypothetical protein
MRPITLAKSAALPLAALALLTGALIAYGTADEPQEPQEPKYVALVLEVKKSCSVRDAEGATPVRLAEKKAVGTKLRAGQQLQCVAGGSMKFKYIKNGAEVAVTETPPKWHPVVNVPARPNPGTPAGFPAGRVAEYFSIPSAEEMVQYSRQWREKSELMQFGHEDGFRRVFEHKVHHENSNANMRGSMNANATAGVVSAGNANASANWNPGVNHWEEYGVPPATFAFTPASPHLASPATFVVRWRTTRDDLSVSILLRDAKSAEVIWGPKAVMSGARSLVSEEARAALKTFRDKNPERVVRLEAVHDARVIAQVEIMPLTAAQEQVLAAELAAVGQASGLVSRIDRADVYASHNLMENAADEYEAALSESPENNDLTLAVAFAQCRLQNYRRSGELLKTLGARLDLSLNPYVWTCIERTRPTELPVR